jgi:hypothetical protein
MCSGKAAYQSGLMSTVHLDYTSNTLPSLCVSSHLFIVVHGREALGNEAFEDPSWHKALSVTPSRAAHNQAPSWFFDILFGQADNIEAGV